MSEEPSSSDVPTPRLTESCSAPEGLSTQAWIILIFFTLVTLMTTGFAMYQGSVVGGIISLLISIIPIVMITYDTNCLTAGNCNMWSWIRTFLHLLPFIILIIVILIYRKPGAPMFG